MSTESTDIQALAEKYFSEPNSRNYDRLYKRMYPGLLNYAHRYVNSHELARDLVNTVMVKVHLYGNLYDKTKGQFSTWLYRALRNDCLHFLRLKSLTLSLDQIAEERPSYFNSLPAHFELDRYDMQVDLTISQAYDECMQILKQNVPENYSSAYVMHYFDKMKYDDIAEQQQIPVNTVRSRIHVCKKLIREEYLKRHEKSPFELAQQIANENRE
jgi:RNA polymerase sigma-70 factor (ECF subfamily)